MDLYLALHTHNLGATELFWSIHCIIYTVCVCVCVCTTQLCACVNWVLHPIFMYVWTEKYIPVKKVCTLARRCARSISARSHGATATAICDENGLHRMSIGCTTWCDCNCKLRLRHIGVAVCRRYDRSQWVWYPFCATGICDAHCRWFNRSRTVWTSTYTYFQSRSDH